MKFFSYQFVMVCFLGTISSLMATPLSFIGGLPFTITSPGLYLLSDTISFSTSSTAIIINSDNVTLDLNGKTINATGVSNNGIAILSGSSTSTRVNVTIKNGALVGFDGFGVTGSGTLYRDIVMKDVTIIGVASTSTGISFANTVDSLFEGCNSLNNFKGAAFNTCRNIGITASRFNNNIGVTGVNGLSAIACDNFVIIDSEFNNNIGTNGESLGAFLTNGGSGWFIKNCTFNNNRADGTITTTGQGLQAQTYHSCKLINCSFNDNRTTAASSNGAQGMFLLTCSAWHITDCEFLRNRIAGGTGTVDGLRFSNGGSHTIERCNISGNRSDEASSAGEVNGLRLANTTGCVIRNAIATGNRATATNSTGNGFNLSSGCSSNSFELCEGSSNEANLTAHGFQDVSGGKNSFVECRAVGQKATTSRGIFISTTVSDMIHKCQTFSQVEGIRDLGAVGNNLYTANLSAGNTTVNFSDNIRTSTINETSGATMDFNVVFFDNTTTSSSAFTAKLSNYSIA